MSFEDFMIAVKNRVKPAGLNSYLEAMYEDAIGHWEASHNIAQDINDNYGSLIHAYLHRKEGDQWNANYWYERAGRKMPSTSLDDEWEAITRELLDKNG